jgi:hypothetical protein
VLFTVIAVAFGGLALASARAGQWVIAAAAAALGLWMASLAWGVLRRTRA